MPEACAVSGQPQATADALPFRVDASGRHRAHEFPIVKMHDDIRAIGISCPETDTVESDAGRARLIRRIPGNPANPFVLAENDEDVVSLG